MERTQKAPAIQGHKLNVVKIKLFVLQTIPSAKWSSHHKGENTCKDTSRAQLQLSDKYNRNQSMHAEQ